MVNLNQRRPNLPHGHGMNHQRSSAIKDDYGAAAAAATSADVDATASFLELYHR